VTRIATGTGLEGVPNFRDLGGLTTADGRPTRFGVLYRSGGFEEVTDRGIATALGLGLRTVIDLRSSEDFDPGNRLRDAGVSVVNIPIARDGSPTDPHRPTRSDGTTDMARVYRLLVDKSAAAIGRLFELVVDGATPAVVHCASGKDRTGVIAALLLGAVGVTRAQIVEDFMRSAQVRDELVAYLRRRPAYSGVVDQFPPNTLDAMPWFIEDFLDDLARESGGILGWLTGPGGVSPTTIASLERLFLDPGLPHLGGINPKR
jgi:protein-tyrosine phosphatase